MSSPWGYRGLWEKHPRLLQSHPDLLGPHRACRSSQGSCPEKAARRRQGWSTDLLFTPVCQGAGLGRGTRESRRERLGGWREGPRGSLLLCRSNSGQWFSRASHFGSHTMGSAFSPLTGPRNIRSQDKYFHMLFPAGHGHPLGSLNTQGTGGGGGWQVQIPLVQIDTWQGLWPRLTYL